MNKTSNPALRSGSTLVHAGWTKNSMFSEEGMRQATKAAYRELRHFKEVGAVLMKTWSAEDWQKASTAAWTFCDAIQLLRLVARGLRVKPFETLVDLLTQFVSHAEDLLQEGNESDPDAPHDCLVRIRGVMTRCKKRVSAIQRKSRDTVVVQTALASVLSYCAKL